MEINHRGGETSEIILVPLFWSKDTSMWCIHEKKQKKTLKIIMSGVFDKKSWSRDFPPQKARSYFVENISMKSISLLNERLRFKQNSKEKLWCSFQPYLTSAKSTWFLMIYPPWANNSISKVVLNEALLWRLPGPWQQPPSHLCRYHLCFVRLMTTNATRRGVVYTLRKKLNF